MFRNTPLRTARRPQNPLLAAVIIVQRERASRAADDRRGVLHVARPVPRHLHRVAVRLGTGLLLLAVPVLVDGRAALSVAARARVIAARAGAAGAAAC